MNVLVLNCGSSSVKYQLIEPELQKTLARGSVERIRMSGATLSNIRYDGEEIKIAGEIFDHNSAIEYNLVVVLSKNNGVIYERSDEEQHQWRIAAPLRQVEHVVDLDVGVLAHFSQNALMAVCDPIERRPLHVLDRDRALLRQLDGVVEMAAFLHTLCHQEPVHLPPVGAK